MLAKVCWTKSFCCNTLCRRDSPQFQVGSSPSVCASINYALRLSHASFSPGRAFVTNTCPPKSPVHLIASIMSCAGFGRLPKGVSISPGDGYGMLLPLETIPLTFSFMPSLTGPYNFQLECQTPLNTKFSLPCTAMARLPAVTLSYNHIQVCKAICPAQMYSSK